MVHEGIVVLDGEMLRPETPLDLDANRRYRVILMPLEDAEGPTAQPAWITLGELASLRIWSRTREILRLRPQDDNVQRAPSLPVVLSSP